MSGYISDRLDIRILTRWVRLDRVTIDVVGLGMRSRRLSSADAISLELERMRSGTELSAVEEEAALLLSDEHDAVYDLFAANCDDDGVNARSTWFYAGAKELRSRWQTEDEAWEQLADLIESFGLDSEYRSLLYYTPVSLFKRAPREAERMALLDEVLCVLGERYGR